MSLAHGSPFRSPADMSSSYCPKSNEEVDAAARIGLAMLAEVTQLMAKSPEHQDLRLVDLDAVIAPPLLLQQILVARVRPEVTSDVAQSKAKPSVAVAFATWAYVSAEIKERLIEKVRSGARPDLSPAEWRSGDLPLLIDVVGESSAAADLVRALRQKISSLDYLRKEE